MAEVKAIARVLSAGARVTRAAVATRRRRAPHARLLSSTRCDATQMIHVGDTLPDATLIEKQEEVKVRDVFKGKTGVLLGMPGTLCVRRAARGCCRAAC